MRYSKEEKFLNLFPRKLDICLVTMNVTFVLYRDQNKLIYCTVEAA